MAVNVTAIGGFIRAMDRLLKCPTRTRRIRLVGHRRADAGLLGSLRGVKAALEALARTYAAETASTKVRVNIFTPGPIRTRMRAQAFPGEDPMTLEPPENPAEKIVDMCLSSTQETGRLYAYPKGKFLDFRPPA